MTVLLRAGLAVALAFGAVACNKEEEVARDVAALEGFGKEVVARVESASDPAAGIEAALAFVEQSRAEMTARQRRVWESTPKVSKEMQERIQASTIGSAAAVSALRISLMQHTRDNPKLEARLDTLIDTYTKLVTD